MYHKILKLIIGKLYYYKYDFYYDVNHERQPITYFMEIEITNIINVKKSKNDYQVFFKICDSNTIGYIVIAHKKNIHKYHGMPHIILDNELIKLYFMFTSENVKKMFLSFAQFCDKIEVLKELRDNAYDGMYEVSKHEENMAIDHCKYEDNIEKFLNIYNKK